MDDKEIIELYLKRSEAAISQTEEKYGKYCHSIAYNILRDRQDSEECVNDAYLQAWNAIPPHMPGNLAAFLGKITRNLALNRYKHRSRKKRGSGQIILALEELDGCIPAENDIEKAFSDREIADALNAFLGGLPPQKRQVFVRRYWYFSPIAEIARDYGLSESNTKVILLRTRTELKHFLEKAGIAL